MFWTTILVLFVGWLLTRLTIPDAAWARVLPATILLLFAWRLGRAIRARR